MPYAQKTAVPIYRSQGEIQKILTKHGATAFAFAEMSDKAMLQFDLQKRRMKFIIPLPIKPIDPKTKAVIINYEQVCKSKWRCLVLAIKAKLECVEAGVTTLEQEFLAHIVLPSGQTYGEFAIPQIEHAYETKKMPLMLGMK